MVNQAPLKFDRQLPDGRHEVIYQTRTVDLHVVDGVVIKFDPTPSDQRGAVSTKPRPCSSCDDAPKEPADDPIFVRPGTWLHGLLIALLPLHRVHRRCIGCGNRMRVMNSAGWLGLPGLWWRWLKQKTMAFVRWFHDRSNGYLTAL